MANNKFYVLCAAPLTCLPDGAAQPWRPAGRGFLTQPSARRQATPARAIACVKLPQDVMPHVRVEEKH